MAESIHVAPEGAEWVVKRESDSDPLSTFPTENHAINFGRDQARNERTELVVHGRDGAIRDRHSYGNDPGDLTD